MLAVFGENILYSMFLAFIAIYVGTITTFKNDRYEKYGYTQIVVSYLKYYPWFAIISLISMMLMWYLLTSDRGASASDMVAFSGSPPYFHFSLGIGLLAIGIVSISMYLSLIELFTGKHRNIFNVFVVPLTIEHRLSWLEATNKGEEGLYKNNKLYIALLIPVILCLVVAPLLGVLIPWIYCIYKEIFND